MPISNEEWPLFKQIRGHAATQLVYARNYLRNHEYPECRRKIENAEAALSFLRFMVNT